GLVVEPLVVVVDGDRQDLLGMVLADHVVVEDLANLLRRRDAVARLHQRGLVLLADDVHAQLDALVADEDGRAGNQLAHLVLALAAERAIEGVLRVAADLAHRANLNDMPGAASGVRRARLPRTRRPKRPRCTGEQDNGPLSRNTMQIV